MKIPRFAWDAFLTGRRLQFVAFRSDFDSHMVLDISDGLRGASLRERTLAEGAGTLDVPDDWLHPCDSNGRPLRAHQKSPHHWIISEKGWMAIREEARARYDDKGTFDKTPQCFGHEPMILSNAKWWVRTKELREKKGIV